ncbi:MAG: hypothetical protein JKY43_00275 [Phycisphaerales bacterium]|nr:hypothetical protein [Phycisphaerales bacterium]
MTKKQKEDTAVVVQEIDSAEKVCFVISPIGEEDSETRRRSNLVLKYIIRPAVEPLGYTAIRADEIDKPGLITSQVIQHIVDDKLVIADLTEQNPNVFYELAIRHALRLPYVQIIRKADRIPFDVAGTRTVQFDHTDLDSVDSAVKSIQEQIKSLEQNPEDLESPISVSIDLQRLRQSDDPEERSIGDILSAVSSVHQSVSKIELRMSENSSEDTLETLRHEMHRLRDIIRHGDFVNPFGMLSESTDWSPSHISEMAMYAGTKNPDELKLLMYATVFKPMAPWVYEAGIVAYQAITLDRSSSVINGALMSFDGLARGTVSGPWSMYSSNKSRRRFYASMEFIAEEISGLVSVLRR